VPDRTEPKYLISTIAKMLDVHPQTLRNYERIGLIKPSRSQGNTRLYSDEDIETIQRVLTLSRDLGVNIAGVEVIMRMREQIVVMQSEFQGLIKFIQSELCGDDSELSDRFQSVLVRSPYRSVIRIENDPKD
jgi:MerR family transcriptional regulator, heat shock protein HspR